MRTFFFSVAKWNHFLICCFAWLACCPVANGQPVRADGNFKLPQGFQAELVYDVPEDQGSWVAITTDSRGRLLASDQFGKLYRLTSLKNGKSVVEPIDLKIGFAQGLLCAFDSLYVVAHADAKSEMPAGLYRIRDTDGDDQYDSVQLLRQFEGGGEHGPHAVILGPDQESLYICGGNHTRIPDPEISRVPRVWQEDQLLTRLADPGGHAVGIMAPGGWICKTDPDGESFELISVGYRNEYDIAFDPNGELFTYDADMEWDIGLPWYRATRVCHVTSGSEFGWRYGSGKWPEYYPDNLPAVVDIGPGSPTGIAFGTGAKFPAKYQRSLFIADWSYGIIYAVHLHAEGSSFQGTPERFCSAPALPVTDLVINPVDGAMYFLIGGRRSQSALYRITYQGPDSTELADYPAPDSTVVIRQQLEAAHLPNKNLDLAQSIDLLGSQDQFIRFAARVALEHQPIERWARQAVEESDPQRSLELILALARLGNPSHQSGATKALGRLDFGQLTESQRLALLRNWGLVLIRLGEPNESTKAAVQSLTQRFPTGQSLVDRELAKLLIAVETPGITEKVVKLLDAPDAQEQQIAYALMLSDAQTGWTIQLRKKYFQWFLDAATLQGGASVGGYLQSIREAAVARLSKEDELALQDILQEPPVTKDPYAELKARPFVKNWSLADLLPITEQQLSDAEPENGRQMFALATCYKCHRINQQGGIVGPDLTPAGHRYSTRDLLETIVDPGKAISDQYEATMFLLTDGTVVTGRVANLTGGQYLVQEDMIQPGNFRRIEVADIEEMRPSKVSMMPTGLLDNLTREEIVDLIAYMKSTIPPAMEQSE